MQIYNSDNPYPKLTKAERLKKETEDFEKGLERIRKQKKRKVVIFQGYNTCK